jgi:hypothetical protein
MKDPPSREVRRILTKAALDARAAPVKQRLTDIEVEMTVVKWLVLILGIGSLIASFLPGVQAFDGGPAAFRYITVMAAVMFAILIAADHISGV